MPIIPTYRRQERYQAPGVQVQAQGPRRLPQAYENALQEGVTAARAVMKYMTPAVPKKKAKQTAKTAVASSKQKGSASGQTALFAASPQAETDLALRSELAERVGRLAAGGERVKTEDLDDFALSRLQAEPAQTPAVRDYMMFRAAAQADEQRQAQEENLARLQAEETLVRGVGALAPSADVLEEYLSAQVPAFEKRLRDNGADSETARKQTASLRAQTAAQCVRYSLSCGNEQTAAQVLEKYGQTMNPAEREECAQKVRFAAADLYARQLWNRARGETDGSPQACAQWVDKQTANIQNKALRQDVCRTSQTLFKQAEAEIAKVNDPDKYNIGAVNYRWAASSIGAVSARVSGALPGCKRFLEQLMQVKGRDAQTKKICTSLVPHLRAWAADIYNAQDFFDLSACMFDLLIVDNSNHINLAWLLE